MANKFLLYSGFIDNTKYDTFEAAKAAVDERLNNNPQAEITILQDMGTYRAKVQVSEVDGTSDSKPTK